VPQATGTPIGRQHVATRKLPATDSQQQNYTELSAAIRESESRERLIEELQPDAHCPFQVFYKDDGIEILCDRLQMKNCSGDPARCRDVSNNCHQAYDYVRDNRRSAQVGKGRKVKVGCIYHPKGIGLSVEAGTVHRRTLV
jgi:hypothetical protein